MDHMHDELTKSIKDEKLNVSLCSALALGVDLLNKYYSLTDELEVYQIAVVLHPSYKLRYFKKAGWSSTWIQTAEEIANKVVSSSSDSSSKDEELLLELDHYLAPKVVKDIKDPLAWWHKNWGSYPRLWRMARDYLTIPAMLVAVECVFSQGRLIISHIQNRLSGQSTRTLMCLGAWTKQNLVKNSDLSKHLGYRTLEMVTKSLLMIILLFSDL
ncbi:hypothetical protein H1R20_g15399, partial [Candolleomyces eurysporus]